MKPSFWKLSQGKDFVHQEIIDSVAQGLVYVHKDTPAQGKSTETQGYLFATAPIGDYFYLTHGNKGIILLGQFSGPANLFSAISDGWLDRPFRFIRSAITNKKYRGKDKWWAPRHNSTFVRVPDEELPMFEEYILRPFFDIKLVTFGVHT